MKKSSSVLLLLTALSLPACKNEPTAEETCSAEGGMWDYDDCTDGRDSTASNGQHYRHSVFGYWYAINRMNRVTRYYPKTGITQEVDRYTHRTGAHLGSSNHASSGGVRPKGGFGSSGYKSSGGGFSFGS